jgi:hypothetical protein
MSIKYISLIPLILGASISTAQICILDNIRATTPTERFIDNKNGTVTDAKTGLQWSRCAIGQSYNVKDSECNGSPIDFGSWSAALQYIDNQNRTEEGFFGFTDFRIPNIKELASIVERQCYEPSINVNVFPSTPSNTFISSTPADANYTDNFRYINYENGAEFTPTISFIANIRVVRN